MDRTNVMQVVDTLRAGGRERVVVNLANLMPRDRYRSYLCTTRRDGPLADLVGADVGRLCLGRRRRFEVRALARLVGFIRREKIQILHAHDAALALAVLASLFPPHPAIVWHDHCGHNAIEERPVWLYRPLAARVDGVIATSRQLVDWSHERLRIPAGRLRYVPNFIFYPGTGTSAPDLPGVPGMRIVCVASLWKVKDQLTLVRAMQLVVQQVPAAHLLLVGSALEPAYRQAVENEIRDKHLADNVSLLGERLDVPDLLRACDVGVLCSLGETSPLAILEYAAAGLAVVTTDVGDCAEMVDAGRAGKVVPVADHQHLAAALVQLLKSAEERAVFGQRLRRRVEDNYSAETAFRTICCLYDSILQDRTDFSPPAAHCCTAPQSREHVDG